MIRGISKLLLINLLLLSSLSHAAYSPQTLLDLRKSFLQTEQYIYQDKDSEYLSQAATLKDYPLYPYLQYQWLKKHLDDNQAVLAFLTD